MIRISKEAINLLPLTSWQGPIHLVADHAAAALAVERLGRENLLGFDTETRPAFRKGQKFTPSLLQLAAGEAVYLFQLSRFGLPDGVCELLAAPGIIKAGVAPAFDLQGLQEQAAFSPAGFADLGQMARQRGISNHGLRGLAAALCGIRVSKSVRTSNWALAELSPQQLRYAATDAWVSRELYLRLAAMPELPE